MEATVLTTALGRRGLRPEAVQDALARTEARFGPAGPSAEELDPWCAELSQQALHLFALPPAPPPASAPTIPEWLPPVERITLARASLPSVEKPRRPQHKDAPPEVRKTWEHLSLPDQMTAYREWRDAQQA
jgi:hypothetical protein